MFKKGFTHLLTEGKNRNIPPAHAVLGRLNSDPRACKPCALALKHLSSCSLQLLCAMGGCSRSAAPPRDVNTVQFSNSCSAVFTITSYPRTDQELGIAFGNLLGLKEAVKTLPQPWGVLYSGTCRGWAWHAGVQPQELPPGGSSVWLWPGRRGSSKPGPVLRSECPMPWEPTTAPAPLSRW